MTPEDIEKRFSYHPATTEEKQTAHTLMRRNCFYLAKYVNETLPEGREKSLAITNLEEAMFWANASLARA